MQIDELQPKEVISYFSEICKIPHGSGNEKAISDYLVRFAKQHNLYYFQDKENNIIIKKSGTKGYENSEPVILQGHMDMVCEKNNDTIHDFLNDPIKLIVDGDFLRADGTTLGGDNGIAVAYSLAILASNDIEHPPLEVLITTNEEVGMDGANALNAKLLNGKKLINIDSEEEGYFLVSCAGGMRGTIHLPISYKDVKNDLNAYIVKVKGLKGGHSGMEIIKQRANANKLMGRILSRLNENDNINIANISGGAKDNAIPREAHALILTKEDNANLLKLINILQDEFMYEFKKCEESVIIELEKTNLPQKMFDNETTKKVIDILVLIPNGIQAMSLDIDGLVETSTNVGVVETKADEVIFTSAVRSCVSTRKYQVQNQLKHLCDVVGATLTIKGAYPAWEYKDNSQLREVFQNVYKKMYGKEAIIQAIHAGLECGLFSEKMPDCDMISFGPDMFDVHTPDEKVSISSVNRCWEFLKEVLKELK